MNEERFFARGKTGFGPVVHEEGETWRLTYPYGYQVWECRTCAFVRCGPCIFMSVCFKLSAYGFFDVGKEWCDFIKLFLS